LHVRRATLIGLVSGFALVTPTTRQAPVPELFAPGTITTAENELNAAFTPDGRTVYFTRAAGANGRFGVIMKSTAMPNGKWSAPTVAEFSGRHSDYDPFVSPTGEQLFFISQRPASGPTPRSDFDIWVVDRAGNGWGAPRRLEAPINSNGDELYPSVASDGTLYFSSCGRPDSRGRCDLYRARFASGRYLEPEHLSDAINTPASETDAYIAPDQSYLVYTVYGRSDAVGDGDLYVSFFRKGVWTPARHLGPAINTAAREYCPIVSPDWKYLYFTSQHGFSDGTRVRSLTTRELRDSLGGVRNGFGNVYRVPVSVLRDSL
jgi:Tol biopolymer transport system component